MDVFEIADLLTTGDGQPLTMDITIIPGDTIEEVAAYLKGHGVFTDETEFLNICRTGEGVTDYYYVDDLLRAGTSEGRRYLLEGYLAPNTYEIYTNATPLSIVRKLLSQTDKVFHSDWQLRADELGITMDEALILASMIEKEAKTADFKRVSAVFHNRLNTNMTLGSDVTIKYVTGTTRMSLTNADLSVNSRYNTYAYAGLPIGPICNPSAAAIEAALYPDESFVAQQYLYFCSKDPNTSELYFSKTLAEHEAAVSIYAPLWKAYDESSSRVAMTDWFDTVSARICSFRHRSVQGGLYIRLLDEAWADKRK
jgi:UPF0755 protein